MGCSARPPGLIDALLLLRTELDVPPLLLVDDFPNVERPSLSGGGVRSFVLHSARICGIRSATRKSESSASSPACPVGDGDGESGPAVSGTFS